MCGVSRVIYPAGQIGEDWYLPDHRFTVPCVFENAGSAPLCYDAG
jgi:hypothetical protein